MPDGTTETAATATTLSKPRQSIIEVIQQPDIARKLEKAATGFLTPDKVIRLTLNAMNKTPFLKACTVESVLAAMMTTTALGLEPNTPLGHAYLIPYRTKKKGSKGWYTVVECQYQIGYKGFVALAHRSPKLVLMQADAVYEKDDFESYLSSETERGTFFRFKKAMVADRGELRGAFCFMRVRNDFGTADMATSLTAEDVYKFRARSETYKFLSTPKSDETQKDRASRERKLAETPWVMWESVMAAKSAIKRHCSQFPLSPEMMAAAAVDNASEAGVLDLEALQDPEYARAVANNEVDPSVAGANGEDVPALAGPSEDGGEEEGEEEGDPEPEAKPEPKKTTAAKAKPAAAKAKPAAAAPKNEPPPPEDGDPGPGGPAGDDDELFKD